MALPDSVLIAALMYYSARYYDPVSGRFISANTIATNQKGIDPYDIAVGKPGKHHRSHGTYESWVSGDIVKSDSCHLT